jgi:hypothetical protein
LSAAIAAFSGLTKPFSGSFEPAAVAFGGGGAAATATAAAAGAGSAAAAAAACSGCGCAEVVVDVYIKRGCCAGQAVPLKSTLHFLQYFMVPPRFAPASTARVRRLCSPNGMQNAHSAQSTGRFGRFLTEFITKYGWIYINIKQTQNDNLYRTVNSLFSNFR